MIAAFAITACSDATGLDCAARYACQVNGVDLALVNVSVDTIASSSYMPIADASNLVVRYTVVNRGDATSSSSAHAQIRAWSTTAQQTLPSLAPGDSVVKTDTLEIRRAYLLAGDDLEQSSVSVTLDNDADNSNNILTSRSLFLNLPFFDLQLSLDSTQTVRIGQTVFFSYTSRIGFTYHEANKESASLLFCLKQDARTCTANNWRPLARIDDADEYFGAFRGITLRADALATPAPGMYKLIICMIPRSFTGQFLELSNPDHRCREGGNVLVLP